MEGCGWLLRGLKAQLHALEVPYPAVLTWPSLVLWFPISKSSVRWLWGPGDRTLFP